MVLECSDCGCGAVEFQRGWRAYRAPADVEPQIVVLCPDCAERELGEDSS